MRTFSTLVKSALSGSQVVARWIVRITLPGGTFGASDGPDWFTWDNGAGPVSFAPLGETAKVQIPSLQTALRTDPATLSFSATDPNVLTGAFDEPYRAAPTDIALLAFDPATGAPGEEVLRFRGKGDQVTIADEPVKPPSAGDGIDPPAASTLAMTVAPQTVDMKRSRGRYATDSDQKLFRDANDGFFKDVALVGVSQMNWGQAGPNAPATSIFNQSGNGSPSGGWGGVGGRGGLGGLIPQPRGLA